MKAKVFHPTPDPDASSEPSRPGIESFVFIAVVLAGVLFIAFGKQITAGLGLS